jgi:transposase
LPNRLCGLAGGNGVVEENETRANLTLFIKWKVEKTTMSYKRYTKAFKQKVLREVEQGGSVSAVSRRFSVSRQLIYEWQQKQRDGSLQDPKTGVATELLAEVAELERKVGQLTMENEFLKKTLERLETRYPPAEKRPEPKRLSKSPHNSKKVMVLR